MTAPNPAELYPLANYNKLVFLKNIISNPNIMVGDYTYYDDFTDPHNFEKNVLYHFDFIGDKLIIGKFCAIASGVKFMMNGGNHETSPISTYPFGIFGHGWDKVNEGFTLTEKYKSKGDTIIGNDVWIGHDALIMPGVKIGNGAIIATRAVVTKNVPDYAIAGGNPAIAIRTRFTDADIARLLDIAWWDWPVEKITEHLHLINSADIDALEKVSR
ncbi:chloramphenicol acetyltransferase [Mucilaginibacter sp. PPCGB 2223]|uniref:CatB-related O-acetyltransferase n=1 Tax=Mucilaginibacter sp. PPCGB 2223 TaxID=1886027 RepID=UPI000824457A|nr:CatB-related O-acetyltransferase [Mucilaginibacter sp. PPCGB 2223]OCX51452.1 chloramphenicol acetyltransferase [Mucilaginibacter sp. PPCGB 2223]